MGQSQSSLQSFLPSAEPQNELYDLQCCGTRKRNKKDSFTGALETSTKPFKDERRVLSKKRSGGFHSSSVKPLTGWTDKEQKVLIDQMQFNQISKKHPRYLQTLFQRTRKLLPGKSMEQIEECHSHLQSHKIAYFGINDKQDEPSKPPTGPIVQSKSIPPQLPVRKSGGSPSASKQEIPPLSSPDRRYTL